MMMRKQPGFTLIELMLVVAVIAILGALLLPHLSGSKKGKLPRCINNLRQVDLAFIMFTSDHRGEFPMQLPVAKGGTMEFLDSGYTFPHYKIIATNLLQTKILVCPFEINRQEAASFDALNDLALSYFVNGDASTKEPTKTVLAGDRFLQSNGQQIGHGIYIVTTNKSLSWRSDVHARGGAIAFADGHVEFVRGNLNRVLANQPSPVNRFSIP